MDTVTHAFMGLTLFGAINKQQMEIPAKRALLFTALAGSQIPDIDVVSQLWDTQGLYQMWHRGITHSVWMAPVWAALLYALSAMIWKVRSPLIFGVGLLAVWIHSTIDLFNAWGTGYLEPFSSIRISFGTIPIVDLFIWCVMLAGWLYARKRRAGSFRIYRLVWLVIALHVLLQSIQGAVIYAKAAGSYEQVAISADFIPGKFKIIAKQGDRVDILDASVWKEPVLEHTLTTHIGADLDQLFENNPKARTLYEWSPFVVIVDDDERIGVYDPRFYRNGQSFLFEYMLK